MILAILKGLFWTTVSSTVGRIGIAVLLTFGAWKANNYYQRSLGVKMAVEKSVKAGKVANAKNAKVRKKASKPGAADRLRRRYCRDC